MSIESEMPFKHCVFCCPLLLLPSIFPSIRIISNESAFTSGGQSIGASASASVLPMNIQDWFALGWTGWISLQSKVLSSLFQHHNSKASILHCSAFFIVQLSHPYMTSGKTIELTIQTFVSRVMFLLFNTVFRFVMSKCLLILWLQSPSTVILEPNKMKIFHYILCFPIYMERSDGIRCHDLSFLNVEF